MKGAFLMSTLAAALLLTSGLMLTAQQDGVAQSSPEPSDWASDPARHTFGELDRNRDGKLSRREFDKLFDMIGKKLSTEDKEAVFKAWDANSDGSISKAEFSANY
jgi:hypothetical protein